MLRLKTLAKLHSCPAAVVCRIHQVGLFHQAFVTLTVDDDGILPGAPRQESDRSFEGVDHERRAVLAVQFTI